MARLMQYSMHMCLTLYVTLSWGRGLAMAMCLLGAVVVEQVCCAHKFEASHVNGCALAALLQRS
jgi:hypothetical protein